MRTPVPFILLAMAGALRLAAQIPAPAPLPRESTGHILLAPVESAAFADLRAADDERTAAMIAADPARLDAILSEDLHYGHSNGRNETKAAFVESLTSGRLAYQAFEYTEHRFIPAAPDLTLMTGRVLVRLRSGGEPLLLDLNFLAVWRREGGKWRFLAWQSTRNPPAK